SSRRLLVLTDGGGRVLDLENDPHSPPPLEFAHWGGCWAFSPDGRTVAIAQNGEKVNLCDLQTGEILSPPLRHRGLVNVELFTADGASVLATVTDEKVALWD